MRDYFLPKKKFRIIFFIGKGGVGKTTTSAAVASYLSGKGYKTLIVSLDPAHNLGDVFMMNLGDKPKEIAENLYGMELDMEKVIKSYLKHLEDSMKYMYRYLTVINLEKYFEVLSYSPGIEEYATLEAIRDILKEGDKWDVIIFDTPPTGLTLRVLALPKIAKIWSEKLIEIRRKILDKRLTIEKIQGERKFVIEGKEYKLPSKEEEDEVLKELLNYKKEVEEVLNTITDENRTSVVAVMNPEMLALYETERAKDSLIKFNIPLNLIIVNKVIKLNVELPQLKVKMETQKEVLGEISEKFKGMDIIHLGMQEKEPRGLEMLKNLGETIVEMG
jgi:arsenite-transporting ATPase